MSVSCPLLSLRTPARPSPLWTRRLLTRRRHGLFEAAYEGKEVPEYLKDREYGSGMVASFIKGEGE